MFYFRIYEMNQKYVNTEKHDRYESIYESNKIARNRQSEIKSG